MKFFQLGITVLDIVVDYQEVVGFFFCFNMLGIEVSNEERSLFSLAINYNKTAVKKLKIEFDFLFVRLKES